MIAHRQAQRIITVPRRTAPHHRQKILLLDTFESPVTTLCERLQCYRSYQQFLTSRVTIQQDQPLVAYLYHHQKLPGRLRLPQAVAHLQPEVIVWKTTGMIRAVSHWAPDGTTTRTVRAMLSTWQEQGQQAHQTLQLKLFLLHELCLELHGTVLCEA